MREDWRHKVTQRWTSSNRRPQEAGGAVLKERAQDVSHLDSHWSIVGVSHSAAVFHLTSVTLLGLMSLLLSRVLFLEAGCMKRLLEVDGRMMVPSAVLLSFQFRSLNFHPPPLGHSKPWVSLGDYTRSVSASEQVTELVGEETHPASAWEIWGSGRWSLG